MGDRFYFYMEEGAGIVRVRNNRKPYKRPKPYVCREWSNDQKFVMGCFPQITFGKLNKMKYIGSVPCNETTAPTTP